MTASVEPGQVWDDAVRTLLVLEARPAGCCVVAWLRHDNHAASVGRTLYCARLFVSQNFERLT